MKLTDPCDCSPYVSAAAAAVPAINHLQLLRRAYKAPFTRPGPAQLDATNSLNNIV